MSDAYIGQIALLAGATVPQGWVACDGTLLKRNEFPVLFSLIGTAYGGDGAPQFAVPDLRGRVSVHAGHGAGLPARARGERFGAEQTSLTEGQLPPHTHDVSTVPRDTAVDPAGVAALVAARVSAAGVSEDATIVEATGDGAPIALVPPALVLTWCIAVDGLYPDP